MGRAGLCHKVIGRLLAIDLISAGSRQQEVL